MDPVLLKWLTGATLAGGGLQTLFIALVKFWFQTQKTQLEERDKQLSSRLDTQDDMLKLLQQAQTAERERRIASDTLFTSQQAELERLRTGFDQLRSQVQTQPNFRRR